MEHQNYIRLQRLVQHGRKLLHQHLASRWKDVFQSDLSTDRMNSFLSNSNEGQKISHKLPFDEQRQMIKEDASTWDITLLCLVLRSNPFKVAPKRLQPIKAVRNRLAHQTSFHLETAEFDVLWSKLEKSLRYFSTGPEGDAEISTIRMASLDDITGKDDGDATTSAAEKHKDLGNKLFSEQKYEEAAIHYTEAIQVPGISVRLLGILYSKRSSCYLEESQFNLAMNDARQCCEFQPKWSESYVRVGQVFMAQNEPRMAVGEFDRALSLDKDNSDIKALKYHATRQVVLANGDKMPELFVERSQLLWITGQQHVENGHKFRFGAQNVAQDLEKAIQEYRKGAKVGNTEAMYNLALSVMDATHDFKTADQLLRQAASFDPKWPNTTEQRIGVVEAQFMLGLHYHYGIYVSENILSAKMWYEKAMSNGSAKAANNLGIMFLLGHHGLVERNTTKAEDLLSLAYKRGEHKAAASLLDLYVQQKQPSQVRHWIELARFHNVLSDEANKRSMNFLASIEGLSNQGEEFLCQMRKFISDSQSNPTYITDDSRKLDRKTLTSYALKGKGDPSYATALLQSQAAFESAMHILEDSARQGYFDIERFLDQAFLCFEHENSGFIFKVSLSLLDHLSRLLSSYISTGVQNETMEMKARLVLAYWMGLRSAPKACSLLTESIAKFPSSCAGLYGFRGMLLCFQERYENALRDFKKALELSGGSYSWRYDLATALRLSQTSPADENPRLARLRQKKVRQAYQDFIDQAPKDHRKVPESFYAIALSFYLESQIGSGSAEALKQMEVYERKGREAEGYQLPYFLPYSEGTSKNALNAFKYARDSKQNLSSSPSPSSSLDFGQFSKTFNDLMQGTGNTSISSEMHSREPPQLAMYRIEIVKKHRERIKAIEEMSSSSNATFEWSHDAPRKDFKRLLVGLQEVTLRDLYRGKDHVASRGVLTVTIIEPPANMTSIKFVVVDKNSDVERLDVYNLPGIFPSNCDQFAIGTEVSIIEPYMRHCMDGSWAIRVDEPSSVMVTGNKQDLICRYCGRCNATKLCSRCKSSRYCDRNCQIGDWTILNHKMICKGI